MAWVFIPSGPPMGNTIDEMKLNFVAHGDKEFMFLVCARQARKREQEQTPKRTESFDQALLRDIRMARQNGCIVQTQSWQFMSKVTTINEANDGNRNRSGNPHKARF